MCPYSHTHTLAPQIPITADLFFSSFSSIHVLKLRFKPDFHPITNWDTPGCPHLYGNFGAEDVEDVREFVRNANDGKGESWREAMGRQGGFLV